MNGWVEAPPRRKGLGCFARGCLILLVFAIVLAIACVAGMYWGFQRHSAIVHGIYWLAKTHSIAEAPVPVPEFTASDNQIQSVRERWQDFEQQTRAGQPAEIELTLNRIVVNGEQVPSDLLRWKYRSRRLQGYLDDYRNIHGIGTIEVRDGKLILRSRTE